MKTGSDFTDPILHMIARDERKVTPLVLKLTNHYEKVNREELSRDLADFLYCYLVSAA